MKVILKSDHLKYAYKMVDSPLWGLFLANKKYKLFSSKLFPRYRGYSISKIFYLGINKVVFPLWGLFLFNDALLQKASSYFPVMGVILRQKRL